MDAGNGFIQVINEQEMKEAIERSGYLIEQRVEQFLCEQGYYVQTNLPFKDLTTGKSREFDIEAIILYIVYKDSKDYIFPLLICECIDNLQPIVFFQKESPIYFMHYEEVKYTGIPVKLWQRGRLISLAKFANMEKYHHYCEKMEATQYCTFSQIKKDGKKYWIAMHHEEHHNAFDSLINALENSMEGHKWEPPEEGEEEPVNIQIYYPMLVVQGDLYCASIKDNVLQLEATDHVQFRKEIYLCETNEPKTYQIDVLSESYLPVFLKTVEMEMKKLVKYFRRKKRIVKLSIERIVTEAKSLEEKPKSYRSILEL